MAGKYLPVPLVYGAGQGRSASFANAQGNQTATADVSFFVYRVSNYQLVTIQNDLLEATRDDAAAFVQAGKLAMDTGIRNMSNDIALDIYGDGSGSRGSYSSITSGVIVLSNAAQVVNFEIGMTLVSYSVSGQTYTQSTAAALGYIIAVDRTAGTITVAASGQGGIAATPTNWSTAFPFLGVQGDVAFGAITQTTGFQKMSGLGAWIPTIAPTSSDLFWGVNRSADVTRLAGVRYDGSSLSIEEALVDAGALVNREGGMPDMCFMNFASYAALEKSLGKIAA